MKGYCAKADIENYTLTTIDSSFDDAIRFWIETIEGFIDNETGRNFIADSVASKRYFDGNGERNLFIDECIEISGLKIYNSLGDVVVNELTKDTHYLVHPYNELPIRKILSKLSNPIGFSRFYQGQKNIEVNAKWGYSVEVPAQIKFACMVLVAGIVNYSNNAEGEIKSEKIGEYSVTYKDEQWKDYETAKEIIKSFTKIDV